MRLFIFGCILLLILVMITAVVKVKAQDRQATRKSRWRKKHVREVDQMFATESEEPEASTTSPSTHTESQHEAVARRSSSAPSSPAKTELEYGLIHVMADPDAPFAGYELLQALLANGLRYGKDKIFHRHQNKQGQGDVLFSLASVNQPGTFDLANMGQFSCPGLTLFVVFKSLRSPLLAYDLMLEAAEHLADDLGGRLYDQQHRPLTTEYADHMRGLINSVHESCYQEET